jgi:hypothetical protein
MIFRIIHQSGVPSTPWKNGRGWTSELAVFPQGAGLDDFDWRISRAGTDQDAPFSLFPQIDRTLLLLAGSLTLRIENAPNIELTAASGPFRFSGDLQVFADLQEKPIRDFNVMTRRGRFEHRVEQRRLEEPVELAVRDDVCVVAVLSGMVTISGTGFNEDL